MEHIRLSLLRWFDSWTDDQQITGADDGRIDWIRIVPFLSVHLACVAVFWVGVSWTALSVCLIMYFIRMFAITAFYHRFFSHRAFQTSRITQFIFAVLGNASGQRGPLWWAGHHRHHHRHSDTPQDPHSPVYGGFWWSHIGWIICRSNFATRKTLVKDLIRYPELIFLDRFDWIVPLFTAVGLFAFGHWLSTVAPQYQTSAIQMLVWGFAVSTILLFHATCAINSISHILGKSRYDTNDHSRNNWVLALLTLGEGWHNNHHRFPTRAKQGVAWWEIDMTYYCLKMMECVGLIWGLIDIERERYVAETHDRSGSARIEECRLSSKM